MEGIGIITIFIYIHILYTYWDIFIYIFLYINIYHATPLTRKTRKNNIYVTEFKQPEKENKNYGRKQSLDSVDRH